MMMRWRANYLLLSQVTSPDDAEVACGPRGFAHSPRGPLSFARVPNCRATWRIDPL